MYVELRAKRITEEYNSVKASYYKGKRRELLDHKSYFQY